MIGWFEGCWWSWNWKEAESDESGCFGVSYARRTFWTHRSLEELTGGLLTVFPWNRTLPVDLSDEVVEDLRTEKHSSRPEDLGGVPRGVRLGLGGDWRHLVDVDLALGRSLQEGAGVPLAGEADARLFGHDALHLQVTLVPDQDHGNLQVQPSPRSAQVVENKSLGSLTWKQRFKI